MKPATPLPWYAPSAGIYSGDVQVCAVRRKTNNNGEDIVQDAAYIVHACNNLPRVIEAILYWLPKDPGEDGTQDAAMRALLRELGEI